MAKKRSNPYENLKLHDEKSVESNVCGLSGYVIDFTGKLEGGHPIDYSHLSTRPKLARNLLKALEKMVADDVDINNIRSMSSFKSGLNAFWRYMEFKEIVLTDTKELTSEIMSDYRSWLYDLPVTGFKSSHARRCWQSVSRLVRYLRDSHDDSLNSLVPSDIEVPTRGLLPNNYDSTTTEPYTRNEILTIERACRSAVTETRSRINLGHSMADKGEDPRLTCGKAGCNAPSWRVRENVLWYTKNISGINWPSAKILRKEHGQYLNATSIVKTKTKRTAHLYGVRPYSRSDAARMLVPSMKDLLPFIILMLIKSGLNLESVVSLKRDCLLGKTAEPDTERVRYTKGRGSNEEMERSFSNKSQFSFIKLIKTVLYITEPLVAHVSGELRKNQLFIGININSTGERIKVWGLRLDGNGEPSKNGVIDNNYLTNMINRIEEKNGGGLFSEWELTNDKGELIVFDSKRFRNSYHRSGYEATGSVFFVSKSISKHHGARAVSTTSTCYLNNASNLELHNNAIRNAQDHMLEEALGCQVITTELPDDGNKTDIVEKLVKETGESEDFLEALFSGEQDVFIAHCKDFYNKPNGKKGKPCDEPWLCFDCKNAIWTSRILPRLINFLDFIEEQRRMLHADDWHEKFYRPWSAIKFGILPRFSDEQVNASSLLAKVEILYVPAYWKSM